MNEINMEKSYRIKMVRKMYGYLYIPMSKVCSKEEAIKRANNFEANDDWFVEEWLGVDDEEWHVDTDDPEAVVEEEVGYWGEDYL